MQQHQRDNYDGFYTLDIDGYYTYKGVSSDTSVHYSEGALLASSNIEVISFKKEVL